MATKRLPPRKPPVRAENETALPAAPSKTPAFACLACGHFFQTRKTKAPSRKCSKCQSTKLVPAQLGIVSVAAA